MTIPLIEMQNTREQMPKDINESPYDEATLTKLDIFEQYIREWLPVFINSRNIKRIKVCDYCAGSGRDSKNVAGSPLRILQTIDQYRDSIIKKGVSIDVIFNEANPSKAAKLEKLFKRRLSLQIGTQG